MDHAPARAPVARPELILASTSPYRRELLNRLRLPFTVHAPVVDETPRPGEAPEQTALRLAEAKARAVGAAHPESLVIGADQVATLDGAQLGKPGDHARALAQLRRMRGRRVRFHSALCLFDARRAEARCVNVPTEVEFRDLDDATLDAYLRAERPYDVAGSAKVEGLGITLLAGVRSIDPTALIGLPLIALSEMLREAGYPLFTL